MKRDAWIVAMERIAPPELALEGDNVGLLVGSDRTEITNVLVALDCTPAVVREATEEQVDLILTHHPQFFRPVRRIHVNAPETAAACLLLRYGINHYTAHTNLDAAKGGVNDVLAELLGVQCAEPFGDGIGRIGELPVLKTLEEFARHAGTVLDSTVRLVGNTGAIVRTVAVIGGSGGMDVQSARASGADVFVTGELKHHEALDALTLGLHCILAGHFETERVVLQPLIRRLQEETQDVQYILAKADRGPFVTVQEE